MNITKKLNAQATKETGVSIEVFKSKNDNELYYKNSNNQLVNVMTDKIKSYDSYSELPTEGVINTFYIVGEDIYMWNGTDYFSITVVPVTPSEIVNFDQDTPTTGGVVFTPDTPNTEDVLYVSSTNASVWIYNGSSYETYTTTIPENTPFYLTGTTIDAGGNKTAAIERSGTITLNLNQTGLGFTLSNLKNSGASNGMLIYRGASTTGGYGLQVQKGSTNQLRTNHDGSLLINDAYNLPNVDGTAGQVLKTDGAGNVSFGKVLPSVQSVVSSATVTPNADTDNEVVITAQAVGLTIANPTGTPVQGQDLMIRIKDNGTAQTIAFGTSYRAIGVTLPTTTVASKTLYLGCIYNATDSKWDILGKNQEA